MPFIITGNPVEGFEYIGPFETPGEAIEWATNNCHKEWWQAGLVNPKDLEP